MKPYLVNCNEMQRKAIMHESGPLLCLAGPGSGKTTVLSAHIKYLIEELLVEPSHILVITFSKAAALEMQTRFFNLMGNQSFPVSFGTFHAIFFHMLCQYDSYSQSSILSLKEKKKFSKMVLFELFPSVYMDEEQLEELLKTISYLKNSGLSFEELQKKKALSQFSNDFNFSKFYIRYQQLLREHKKLDFDDMMLLCNKMLNENPKIRSLYQNQYQHILIDEYQDINPVQYAVIQKLLYPQNNLFAVGDDDQSIYGFRGCDPTIMLRFQSDFKEGKIISFPYNYRSVPSIVEGAKKLIRENSNRFDKDIHAFQKEETMEKTGIRIFGEESEDAENERIVRISKNLVKNGSYQQTALLCRTNLECSSFAELLLKNKIPCRIKEKVKNIYESFIARDLICYLRLSRGSRSLENLITIMNRPCRYISRHAIQGKDFSFPALNQFYQDQPYVRANIKKLEYDLEWLSKMDFYAAINYIRKGIGYEDFLKKLAMEQQTKVEPWLEQLEELHIKIGKFSNLDELDSYMEEYDRLLKKQQTGNTAEGITLMTYHACKGLEFDTILLPHCNEGYTPLKKCVGKDAMEEERRLFYVALTRAKKLAIIFYVKGKNHSAHLASRFIQPFLKKT